MRIADFSLHYSYFNIEISAFDILRISVWLESGLARVRTFCSSSPKSCDSGYCAQRSPPTGTRRTISRCTLLISPSRDGGNRLSAVLSRALGNNMLSNTYSSRPPPTNVPVDVGNCFVTCSVELRARLTGVLLESISKSAFIISGAFLIKGRATPNDRYVDCTERTKKRYDLRRIIRSDHSGC